MGSVMGLACECRRRLLNADEVSEWLQVSKSWLYDSIESGKFPHVRVGRQVRFRHEDVESYLNRVNEESVLKPHKRSA